MEDMHPGESLRRYYYRVYHEAYEPIYSRMYPNPNAIKVFLSHPNSNAHVKGKFHHFADWVASNDPQIDAWIDKNELGRAGKALSQDEMREMIQAVDECDVIVIGIPEGPVSDWLKAENIQANTEKKRILHVYFDNAKIRDNMPRDGYVRIVEHQHDYEHVIASEIKRMFF